MAYLRVARACRWARRCRRGGAAGSDNPVSLTQPLYPLALPAVPLGALAGILVAAIPSLIAPAPAAVVPSCEKLSRDQLRPRDVAYPAATTPSLENVNLTIEEGHFALVIGATGAGKSTLLRCVNGLVRTFPAAA